VTDTRIEIRRQHDMPEAERTAALLAAYTPGDAEPRIAAAAGKLIHALRQHKPLSPADALMREYDLSSEEGLTLMELAEALLRIPDAATRDLLIRDKIGDVEADWAGHRGESSSSLVNIATLGLGLSAKLLSSESKIGRLATRLGAPVMRAAVGAAMRQMGARFVFAETIEAALARAKKEPAAHFSFDMLGEGARTDEDALRYYHAYAHSIEAIAQAYPKDMPGDKKPGISVKLSALDPRYELAKMETLKARLLPRLVQLARAAAAANITLVIDAEEDDRLEASLDLFEALLGDTELANWNGLGLAVQAYNKAALAVVDHVIALAKRRNRRLVLRLVKGAYWDTEIKRAQEAGLADYPVYTRKVTTDLSYLAAARKMLGAGAALYPQFGTHNAYTVAAIHDMAARDFPDQAYEFQRLHGMGAELYEAFAASASIPVRVYAPVGPHRDLLAYLVRRLLENGANSSFVAQISDRTIPVERLTQSPAAQVKVLVGAGHAAHDGLPRPTALYPGRQAAPGEDFGKRETWARLHVAVKTIAPEAPLREATLSETEAALARAAKAQSRWAAEPVEMRARALERAADLFIAERDTLLALIVQEGKRTIRNALGEHREAVDFLRYYAAEARRLIHPRTMPGVTGEENVLTLHGRGVFACISPWNFPLSIFTGQIAAALVTGNAVLAKPAEQTPRIARAAVGLLHKAGVPKDVLHFVPGPGETIGAALAASPLVDGIVFTGSTATARVINKSLAQRAADHDAPLASFIAETGGQNAMIVDSSALLEQAADAIVASAFDSAGQRCSALRVLAVQEDIARPLLAMLKGAMAELTLGDPADPATDIGPVIDADAKRGLTNHVEEMRRLGMPIFTASKTPAHHDTFFAPHLIELDRPHRLTREVFGPILHVITWKAGELEKLVESINDFGYGLTLGLHTRLDSTIDTVRHLAKVGNLYVNRSQIGAVVESQPFGGERLSGTGPKAGGPHYLARFTVERTLTVNTAAAGGNAHLLRSL
jgi:RHH-type proline utilization regulon transcriptional repressor/proline dehydrogenase/delta 1-pyrroline-5-carboxylate dehydrogenase